MAKYRTGVPNPQHGQPACASVESPAAVWEKQVPGLRRVVAGLGAGAAAAEDILQDVYLALLERPPRGAGARELKAWLYRVTVNKCRLRNRKRRLRQRALRLLGRRLPDRAQDAADVAASRDQRQAVRAALAELDEKLKTPLVLRYFNDMNSGQIAQILKMPDATVRDRLRRARMKLAAVLLKAGYRHE